MLAVAGGDSNIDCAKLLVQAKADTAVTDPAGNTLLHIAAVLGHNEMLAYIVDSVRLNIFDRNNNGETALSIV